MQYMGGKARQAKFVREIIADMRGNRGRYLEPFMGGGSVFSAVAPDFSFATGADASPALIALWREAVYNKWQPPVDMTEDEYQALRVSTDNSALRGWAGYGASYRGKWFAGFSGKATHRDYLAESARGLERKAAALRWHSGLSLVHADYTEHVVTAGHVVYCDPPYAGTESYGAADEFDHAAFWDTAQAWSTMGALVLVHEYTAPEGWFSVFTRDRVEVMDRKSSGARPESLFMYNV